MTTYRCDNQATITTEGTGAFRIRHMYRRSTSLHWVTIREARDFKSGTRLQHKACVCDDYGNLVDLDNGALSTVSLRDGAGMHAADMAA